MREMIRNIPEHSEAGEVWHCAQYWPSKNKVELSLLDEGIGIYESLSSNSIYSNAISSDKDALELSLRPGVSRKFSPNTGKQNVYDDFWKNSGYGLYMASQICANLGGSFLIASGSSALRMEGCRGAINIKCIQTNFSGTAIQMIIDTRYIGRYGNIKTNILKKGEGLAKNSINALRSASTSSRGLY
ncbi:MAG: hypothetical protein N2315_02190 [Thermanaerothrix sp.]|nr:hypothetical protein [Thermanaerothrix sp.]